MSMRIVSTDELVQEVRAMYADHRQELPFHNWSHIRFVREHALQFAKELGADTLAVDIAALLHDLNFVVGPNSTPKAGKSLRQKLLTGYGYSDKFVANIEAIIAQSYTANRVSDISPEAKALSDADTLFKALPITPILFASRYMSENNISLKELAVKVVTEQKPLFEKGYYFYTKSARVKYSTWAETNLRLWENVVEFFSRDNFEEYLLTGNS